MSKVVFDNVRSQSGALFADRVTAEGPGGISIFIGLFDMPMQSAVVSGVLQAELHIDDATEQLLTIRSILESAGYSGSAEEMVYAILHDATFNPERSND